MLVLWVRRLVFWGVTMVMAGRVAGAEGRFDVRAYGAKGDGTTLDTVALREAIAACGAAGGGLVVFPEGRYLTGSLRLEAGVRLHLEEDAVILGSTSMDDFRDGPLILARDVSNVGIEGPGTVDGQGTAFWERARTYSGPSYRGTAQFEYKALRRPAFIRFEGCRGVTVRDVTLTGSPSWTVHLKHCVGASVTGVTIRNPLYGPNTDGIDVNGCVDVEIADCDIITGDDGIVLKSTDPGQDYPCRDIRVRNCRVWSACNAFKIGTETHGPFENITVRNCLFYGGSDKPLERPLSAIAIESVDGSAVTGIEVSDITIVNVRTPIFVRLGHRGGNSEQTRQVEPRVPGSIDGVVIRNVRAERAHFESSITGMPGHPVRNVVLENVNLSYTGGGTPDLVTVDVPDEEIMRKYPEAQMFGRLPAYGLYCRHVTGLQLKSVVAEAEQPDARSFLVCEDVSDLTVDGLVTRAPSGAAPILWFREMGSATVRGCKAPAGTGDFLVLEGAGEVALIGNDLSGAERAMVRLAPGALVAGRLPLFREEPAGVADIPVEELLLSAPMQILDAPDAPGGRAIGVPLGGGRDTGTARGRFEVSLPGEYLVEVVVHAASPESDSFYVAIDGGPTALSDVAERGRWFRDVVRDRDANDAPGRTAVRFRLEPGVHTLMIRNREAGTRIAAVRIVRQTPEK